MAGDGYTSPPVALHPHTLTSHRADLFPAVALLPTSAPHPSPSALLPAASSIQRFAESWDRDMVLRSTMGTDVLRTSLQASRGCCAHSMSY